MNSINLFGFMYLLFPLFTQSVSHLITIVLIGCHGGLMYVDRFETS